MFRQIKNRTRVHFVHQYILKFALFTIDAKNACCKNQIIRGSKLNAGQRENFTSVWNILSHFSLVV